MKKHLILFFAGVILSYGNIKAQTAPDKKEILKVTLQVNDYFMKKYADYRTPSFVKKVVRPSNIWTRSVYYEGLMALYSIYPADEYYLYAKEWADYHQWGFHRGTTTRNADNYCASQIYLDLYNICPDPEKIRKTKANMDMLVNTPQVNDWWPAGGVLFGKLMYVVTGGKVNPLIGSAGVSAVPMAARVSQKVGQQENPGNFLLMHAMGPNVAGVIGSAVAAGVLLSLFG